MSEQRFIVTPQDQGARVDAVVRNRWPEVSRRHLNELFGRGQVRIDGRAVRKGTLVTPGQTICIHQLEQPPPELPALDVVVERHDVLIVNKPAGLPSAPIPFDDKPCLAAALLARYPELRGIGFREGEAGLLSRLDTDTSGLVLCARTQAAFEELRAGAAAGRLLKQYQGLVANPCSLRSLEEFTFPLGPHKGNRRKVATGEFVRGRASPTRTLVSSVKSISPRVSLVTLQVHNAYRHQLRVHLALAGCPLLGDRLYGGPHCDGLQRHALHAQRVAWPGSTLVARFDVTTELPSDLVDCLGAN